MDPRSASPNDSAAYRPDPEMAPKRARSGSRPPCCLRKDPARSAPATCQSPPQSGGTGRPDFGRRDCAGGNLGRTAGYGPGRRESIFNSRPGHRGRRTGLGGDVRLTGWAQEIRPGVRPAGTSSRSFNFSAAEGSHRAVRHPAGHAGQEKRLPEIPTYDPQRSAPKRRGAAVRTSLRNHSLALASRTHGERPGRSRS